MERGTAPPVAARAGAMEVAGIVFSTAPTRGDDTRNDFVPPMAPYPSFYAHEKTTGSIWAQTTTPCSAT